MCVLPSSEEIRFIIGKINNLEKSGINLFCVTSFIIGLFARSKLSINIKINTEKHFIENP